MEAFLERFELETDSEHFTPGVRALYVAYDELLTYYEKPSGKQLPQMNRVAAVETREEEPPEFRRQTGLPSRSSPAAAAAPGPKGSGGPKGPNSKKGGPTLQREAEKSGELEVLEALVMSPH